jgi:hypothetical protein
MNDLATYAEASFAILRCGIRDPSFNATFLVAPNSDGGDQSPGLPKQDLARYVSVSQSSFPRKGQASNLQRSAPNGTARNLT